MVAQLVAALERPISRVRLENYRPGNGTDLDMIVNYFHNLELSEALYPTLQAFEIALRNSVHLTLTQHFQDDPYWFDSLELYPPPKPPVTMPWQVLAIQAAREKLTREKKPHDADRVVAEMHLGFWHGLFNRPFESKLWRPNQSALVGHVFPLAPNSQRNRQSVWNRIERIRIIRNRVMHYEPIWQRARLQDDHATILEALGWISADMHASIAMCDRFPVVLASRPGTEARVRQEIQRRYPPVQPLLLA
jgi:hypothetical protein